MKQYTYDQVYDAAHTALNAVYVIARNDIRERWKHMTREQRYNAMRGLVVIGRVARDPKKYLSRQHTETAWRERAVACAAAHNIHDVMYAYHLVPSPELIVVNAAEKALFSKEYGVAGMRSEFYDLTENIREYDYSITSPDVEEYYLAPRYAKEIIKASKRLDNRATEIKEKLSRRKALAFCHSLKVYGH